MKLPLLSLYHYCHESSHKYFEHIHLPFYSLVHVVVVVVDNDTAEPVYKRKE